jgi:multidrug efflux pump subunit AcrA (membrane-fusion protein)
MKRTIRNVIVAFVLLMAGLTLFSNTLLNFSLPQVTVERAAPGVLSHVVSGSGTVQVAETVDLTLDTNWKVDQVLVEKGDKVTAGQTLVTFKTEDARNELLDEKARYEQKRLSLQKLQDSYIEAQKAGNELQSRAIMRDIDSARLDLQIQERKIAKLEQQLAQGTELVSTVTGTVVELNATEGLPVTGNRSIARVTNEEKGFQFTTTIDTDQAQYVSVGDPVEVIVPSLNNARLQGVLAEINDPDPTAKGSSGAAASTDGTKELVVDLLDERLKGGEEGELYVSKRMPQARQTISNAAIREDENGKYVLVLLEKEGPLGNEYYARRAAVAISDSDDTIASIENGITPLDQIIVSSTKPIQDGDRVVIAP